MNHEKFNILLALQAHLKGGMIPSQDCMEDANESVIKAHNHRFLQKIWQVFTNWVVYEMVIENPAEGYLGPDFPPEIYGEIAYSIKILVQLTPVVQWFELRVGIRKADHYWFCDVADVRPFSDSPPDIGFFKELV